MGIFIEGVIWGVGLRYTMVVLSSFSLLVSAPVLHFLFCGVLWVDLGALYDVFDPKGCL